MIERLKALLAQGQDNALLRFSLGNAYAAQGEYPAAIEHLQKALQHDPSYSAAWKLLGKAQTEAGRSQEAVTTYQRGIETAEQKGDVQAAKEMRVFLKRLQKPTKGG